MQTHKLGPNIVCALVLFYSGITAAETRLFLFLQPSFVQAFLSGRIPWEKEIEPKSLGVSVDAGTLKITDVTLSKWSDRNRIAMDLKFDFAPTHLKPVSGVAHVTSGIEYMRYESGGEFYLVRPAIETLEIDQYGRVREGAIRMGLNLWLARHFKAKPFFVLNMEKFFPQVTHYLLQKVVFSENHLIAYIGENDARWSEFIDVGQNAEEFMYKGAWLMPNGPPEQRPQQAPAGAPAAGGAPPFRPPTPSLP